MWGGDSSGCREGNLVATPQLHTGVGPPTNKPGESGHESTVGTSNPGPVKSMASAGGLLAPMSTDAELSATDIS